MNSSRRRNSPGHSKNRGGSGNRGGGHYRGNASSNNSAVSLNKVYDSAGPDVKIKGTASHIYEKYVALARDASSSGDRVLSENYMQHAEHYLRIIKAVQEHMRNMYRDVMDEQPQESEPSGYQTPDKTDDGDHKPEEAETDNEEKKPKRPLQIPFLKRRGYAEEKEAAPSNDEESKTAEPTATKAEPAAKKTSEPTSGGKRGVLRRRAAATDKKAVSDATPPDTPAESPESPED